MVSELTVKFPRSREVRPVISILNSLGAREQTAVDCIHNRRGADHAAPKIAAVEPFNGILASLNFIKLEVDVTL